MILATAPRLASAAGCPAGSLPPAQAERRLGEIRDVLRDQAHRGRVWLWGWSLGYGALTLGQAAPAPFVDDSGLRADLVVGASTAAVGLVSVLASAPESIASSDALERDLAGGAVDPCVELGRAEDLLARAARDQAFATSWIMHAANVGLNVAAGLVLGLGFDRWASGAITAASGIAVGEAQILTTPTGLLDPRWRPERPLEHVVLIPWVGRDAAGLQLAAVF